MIGFVKLFGFIGEVFFGLIKLFFNGVSFNLFLSVQLNHGSIFSLSSGQGLSQFLNE
jgi:hypothetical protein